MLEGMKRVPLLCILLAACDCGGGEEPECTSSVECGAGRVCLDGECVTRSEIDGGADVDASTPPDAGGGVDAGTCESAVFCGSPPVCCGAGTECVEAACVPVCESGVRCADACCDGGEVCISDSCTEPGEECTDSFDCPMGAFCEPTLSRCLPQFDPVECSSTPVFGEFETTLERSLTSSDTRSDCFHPISSPTILDLDGDEVPEIISNMACDADWQRGVVRVFRGDTGEELWVSEVEINGRVSTGAADLGDGTLAIVTLLAPSGSDGQRAVAFDAAGGELWRSTDEDGDPLVVSGANGAPTFADLDGDGTTEILFGAVVLDADGQRVWQADGGGNEGTNRGYTGGITVAADVDLDGSVDVIPGRRAYERDGTPKWVAATEDDADGYPAVAQFDDDPQAEIALVADGNVYLLDGETGAIEWGPVAIPGGGRGGPPTIADFDGDGLPEIGVAGGASYGVYDPDGDVDILWSMPTTDQSSNATGSSVFDFEGDGIAEVVYQEECFLRVYRGTDGMVLLEIPNSSATIHEYPLVVDVDADGNSEIVVVANSRDGSIPDRCDAVSPGWDGNRQGIFLYGDARDQWVRTRRVWNQHAYHVTNVGSDGSIPAVEPNNWETPGLNNYRQNVQGEGVYNAPDLAVGLEVSLAGCPTTVTLRARVVNEGSLGVPAGVEVAFRQGDTLLGTNITTVPLLPGASTIVELDVDLSGEGPFAFEATVDDDGSGAGVVLECDEENNDADIDDVDCNLLI